ncbi:hypothetical protein K443DRAFT_289870 [Laccaria amethystina LaAM-08-1]|uniref:Uncharacterized protein n=1 Tax=Laccaria amethystina LaAM-08-1 TaxID=1095629 RepID=A0A0C9X2B6_9AGAR|nr:hypothetical protein K443DRAFT_289870 [Laccaria amethystina LaAM-08-1]
MPSLTTLIRSRNAPHTMLGYCRPPDHKRKLEPKSWRVGITATSFLSFASLTAPSVTQVGFTTPLR